MEKKKRVSIQEIKREKKANQILTSEPWHVPEGGLIREFVFGTEDGMVSTLGIVTGFVGAAVSNNVVLLAGVVEVVTGAFSMAAGTYLATKSQIEFYNKEIEREKREMYELPEIEKEEIRLIYKAKGFKGKELESIVEKITSDKKVWLKVMMEEELGLVKGKFENPKKASAVMGISFVSGGILPIFPYLVFGMSTALPISIGLTIAGLFCAGAGKTILTKKKWWKSGFEMLVVGLLAAGVAFMIGRAIGGVV